MKILSVRFKNITSLKGEWIIPFDQPPLSESGIVAIIGSTGAGKSSILDAITLSLFGETVRLGRINSDQIMTKHTADCYAETIFISHGKKYLCKWSLHRARNKSDGKIQNAYMELSDLNAPDNGILEEGSIPVRKRIIEIIGLDFKRFIRSIMLAQGNFASFLNAPDKERAELLEKITGTEMYSEISRMAYYRAKAENEKLRDIQLQLAHINMLSKDQLDQLNLEITQFTKIIDEKKKIVNTLIDQKNWRVSLQKLEKDFSDATTCYENKRLQFEETKQERDTIHYARQALTFQPDIQHINSLENQKKLVQKDIESLNIAIANNSLMLDDLRKQLTHHQDILATTREERDKQSVTIDYVIGLDRDIEQRNNELKTIHLDIENLKQKHAQLYKQSLLISKKIQTLEQQKNQLTIWLESNRYIESLQSDFSLIKDRVQQIGGLHEKINTHNIQINTITTDYNLLQSKLLQFEADWHTQKSSIDKSEKEIVQLDNSLFNLLESKSLDDIDDMYRHLKKKSADIQLLLSVAGNYNSVLGEYHHIETTMKQNDLKKNQLHNDCQLAQAEMEQEQTILMAIEKAVFEDKRIEDIKDYRSQLVHGQPCPLCGSLDHPYVHYGVPEKKHSEQALEKQKNRFNTIKKKYEQLSITLSNITARIEEQKTIFNRLASKLEIIKNEFNDLNQKQGNAFTIAQSIQMTQIASTIELDSTDLEKKIQAIKQLIQKKEALIKKQAKQTQELALIQDAKNKLSIDMQKIAAKLNLLNQTLQTIHEQHTQHQTELEKMLLPFDIHFQEQDKQLINQLESRIKTFQKNTQKMVTIDKDIQTEKMNETQIYSDFSGLAEQLKDITIKMQHKTDQRDDLLTKRKDIFGNKDPFVERKRFQDKINQLIKSCDKASQKVHTIEKERSIFKDRLTIQSMNLDNVVQELSSHEKKLLTQITDAGFNTLADLRNRLLPIDQLKQLEMNQKKLEESLKQSQIQLNAISTSLTLEQEKKLTPMCLDDINKKLESEQHHRDMIQKELGAKEALKQQQDKLKHSYLSLSESLKQQEKECHRWNQLNNLIGSKSGDEFRKFAQYLTLDHLIMLSNRHLKQLNPRYELNRQSDQKLTIEIIDTFQANIQRPANTLSGGESFLVSLALALGLSDLASQNMQVESLFLDEGFGFLDEESMDMALSTLESLQHTGKMVGIISHVEAVKERISTQIYVEKLAGGVSQISIHG